MGGLGELLQLCLGGLAAFFGEIMFLKEEIEIHLGFVQEQVVAVYLLKPKKV